MQSNDRPGRKIGTTGQAPPRSRHVSPLQRRKTQVTRRRRPLRPAVSPQRASTRRSASTASRLSADSSRSGSNPYDTKESTRRYSPGNTSGGAVSCKQVAQRRLGAVPPPKRRQREPTAAQATVTPRRGPGAGGHAARRWRRAPRLAHGAIGCLARNDAPAVLVLLRPSASALSPRTPLAPCGTRLDA